MAEAMPERFFANCSSCSFGTENEEEFLKHCKKHLNEHNFKIQCPNCHTKLKTVDNYRKHKKLYCQKPNFKESLDEEPNQKQDCEPKYCWQCINCEVKIELNQEIDSPEIYQKIGLTKKKISKDSYSFVLTS